ncbi:MAG: dTDP-4-dehydrorhamnose 3,5-epimerase [Gammaproteobacteria bacterium]
MEFFPTALPEVMLIKPRVFEDRRGFFLETWSAEKFATAGHPAQFVQDNLSRSVRDTLRGLHYQIQRPQGKLVRAVRGEIYDVAVDLRRGSPTFGKWQAAYLSADNKHALWVPAGFAHGFLVTSDVADVQYKCTDNWFPQHERTLLWNDAELKITWPLSAGRTPLLSDKDQAGKLLREAETYP